MAEERLFAVFVDGENVSYRQFASVVAEIESQGTIAFKRVYADWTNAIHKNLGEPLNRLSARPYQQFHYDKDSTDNAILMDVLETILTNLRINSVCIVASDHIYHSVAMRVRERGLYMLGIGNRSTPRSFVDACHSFVYFDNLPETEMETSDVEPTASAEEQNIEKFLILAVRRGGGEKVALSTVGHHIKQMDPAFDARSYGHDKLLSLFESYGQFFQIETDEHTPPVHYVSIRSADQQREIAGTVEKWISAANYGFIQAEAGTYYFHNSNIADTENLPVIRKGQRVLFSEFKKPDPDGETSEEKNGKAANVRIQ